MHIVDSDLMQSKLTSACMHLIIASKLSHLDVGGLHALALLTQPDHKLACLFTTEILRTHYCVGS